MESQADERDPFHVVVGGCDGGLHDHGGLGDVKPCTGLFHSAAAALGGDGDIFSQTIILPRPL